MNAEPQGRVLENRHSKPAVAVSAAWAALSGKNAEPAIRDAVATRPKKIKGSFVIMKFVPSNPRDGICGYNKKV